MLPNLYFRNATTNPYHYDLWGELDRMFDAPPLASPAYEVEDSENHYFIAVDLPGVPKDQVHVEAENGRLTIRGERPLGEKRGQRKFALAFQLPKDVDREKVEALFENGVLKLALPKIEEAKPRRIEVKEEKTGFFSQLLKGEKKGVSAEAKAI